MLSLLEINDKSSSPNLQLAACYWALLHLQGLAKHAFYDGSVTCPSDFLDLSRDPSVILFLILDTEKHRPVGHFHLTHFLGKSATGHFSLLKRYQGREGIRIGKEVINLIFDLKTENNKPLVTNITGITPVTNKLACRFIQLIGFVKQFILKDSCVFQDGRIEHGMVTMVEAS